MTDEIMIYDNQQFEQLVRAYVRCGDRGVSGLVTRIALMHEAQVHLEPERFEEFCQRVHLRQPIEKDLLIHFSNKLQRLDAILGRQLEGFAVLYVLMSSRDEFEEALALAAKFQDPDARYLLRDLTDHVVSEVKTLQKGTEKDIWGMTWIAPLSDEDKKIVTTRRPTTH